MTEGLRLRIKIVCACILLVLALAYFLRAAIFTINLPGLPMDMGHRVNGLGLISAGISPYTAEVSLSYDGVAPDPPAAWLYNQLIYGYVALDYLNYYYLVTSAALIGICSWLPFAGQKTTHLIGPLLGSASLAAISAWCSLLGVGQNAIHAILLLTLSLWSLETKRDLLAGLFLGMALLKPQIAALFVCALLVKGNYRALAGVAIAVLAGYLYLCLMTQALPWTVSLEWLEYVRSFPSWPGLGLLNVLEYCGVSQHVGIVLVAITLGLLAVILTFYLRRAPYFLLFAILCVIARFWSYHQWYDNGMLLFLLIAFYRFAGSSGQACRTIALSFFGLVGVTLWAPGRCVLIESFQFFQFSIWVLSVIILIFMYHKVSPEGLETQLSS